MIKFLSLLLLAILTILALSCNWFGNNDPTKPDATVYAYEGTFLSDSGRDLTEYGWQFEFVGDCNDYREGKLPSDKVMRADMECTRATPHEVRLYKKIYDSNDPGPYASFSNISWQQNAKGDKYTFVFHVK